MGAMGFLGKNVSQIGSFRYPDRDREGEYMAARSIFKKSFITPEEMRDYGIRYDDAQLKHLHETAPGNTELSRIEAAGFVVVAMPPKSMTLFGIYNLYKNLFRKEKHSSYVDVTQGFSRKDTTGEVRWLTAQRTPMSDSMGKSGDVQLNLFHGWNSSERRFLGLDRNPNVAEVAWLITILIKMRRDHLFRDICVRTFSSAGLRCHVGIGTTDRGIVVVPYPDRYEHGNVGIAVVRR